MGVVGSLSAAYAENPFVGINYAIEGIKKRPRRYGYLLKKYKPAKILITFAGHITSEINKSQSYVPSST